MRRILMIVVAVLASTGLALAVAAPVQAGPVDNPGQAPIKL